MCELPDLTLFTHSNLTLSPDGQTLIVDRSRSAGGADLTLASQAP